MTEQPQLWHYTCDHGRAELGEAGELLPAAQLDDRLLGHWPAAYVWLTDQARPDRLALGLTSQLLRCDRLAHRYRVTDPSTCSWWPRIARRLPAELREQLDGAPGARPAHWWTSAEPVPVVLDELAP